MGHIVIVGGGVIGSSIAYYLAAAEHGAEVHVIEPDPSYEYAATPRSTGGVRVLFSVPENIRMSQYGHEIYAAFETLMAIDGEPAPIGYHRGGYLFLASGGQEVAMYERLWNTQTALGCRVDMIDRTELARRFPSLRVDDVDAALHSPDDGWIDAHSALMGFRRKAISLGAAYVKDRVVGIEAGPRRAERVLLESGERIEAEAIVNAANCWAPEVCAMVGLEIPVEPMHRPNFYWEIPDEIEEMALTKDTSLLDFRSFDAGFIGSATNSAETAGFRWDVAPDYFEDVVWPRLAHRVPAFETLRLKRFWAGHYDENRLDGNMIIGPWIGGLENFHLACGFSGHGLQHAPAVGRAFKELLIDGGFQTIDLARFSYKRILNNAPLREEGPTS